MEGNYNRLLLAAPDEAPTKRAALRVSKCRLCKSTLAMPKTMGWIGDRYWGDVLTYRPIFLPINERYFFLFLAKRKFFKYVGYAVTVSACRINW